jgi:nucleotide-binding universal stress UspA family protein
MIKKILLPLKFSHVTDNAFDMALRLTKCCEARLHIFHALDHRSPRASTVAAPPTVYVLKQLGGANGWEPVAKQTNLRIS